MTTCRACFRKFVRNHWGRPRTYCLDCTPQDSRDGHAAYLRGWRRANPGAVARDNARRRAAYAASRRVSR